MNFDKESKSGFFVCVCVGGGGGGDRRSDRIKVSIPYTQSYIKFQVPSSSGSLVLKQIKGVTDRKGT